MSLCISPTLIAKSLEGTPYHPTLTLGTTEEGSEYKISNISSEIHEICYDEKLSQRHADGDEKVENR